MLFRRNWKLVGTYRVSLEPKTHARQPYRITREGPEIEVTTKAFVKGEEP
jgi:hypothetical protein